MKKILLNIISVVVILCFSTIVSAQTTGTLTFSFNQPVPTAPAPTYAKLSVLAVWIENNAGLFIKTKMRFVGTVTSDHLPSFSLKAGGVAATNNAMATSVNITDAVTGATLGTTKVPAPPASWLSRSFVWDGKDVAGALNGVTVPDGIYKVWIESTWVDGANNSHQELSSYSFTKGPTSATTTAVGDAYVNTISMVWAATGLGLNSNISPNTQVVVYPNPSKGIVNVDFRNEINNIKVSNMLGQVVYEEKVAISIPGTTKNIDLSRFGNGIYIVNVSNNEGTSNYKLILDK